MQFIVRVEIESVADRFIASLNPVEVITLENKVTADSRVEIATTSKNATHLSHTCHGTPPYRTSACHYAIPIWYLQNARVFGFDNNAG